tara:strand:- start:45041 stop:46087 length:1047 start_codon:yes stop_codon:yes gene_type:complete
MGIKADIAEAGEASINETSNRLRRSVTAHGLAFENATVGIGHISMTGHWQYANGALARILGYSVAELAELTCQEMTHSDELPDDADRVLKLLAGELKHYAIDKRFRRSDGSYVWTRKTLVVKHKENGDPEYLIAVIEDIDQRKQNEAENAFLIQELAHRSRNLLSVISSLTSLLAPTCQSVEEFQERLLDRLHAISLSNNHLLSDRYEGAPLKGLVHSQLEAFLGGDRSLVVFDGPSLTVNPKAAHAISLALYELASNALKYGAFSHAGGRIEITWAREGSGPDATFRFVWREFPQKQVTPPARVGYGTTVLESIAPMGIRGRSERVFNEDGFVWKLEAPLESVLTPA